MFGSSSFLLFINLRDSLHFFGRLYFWFIFILGSSYFWVVFIYRAIFSLGFAFIFEIIFIFWFFFNFGSSLLSVSCLFLWSFSWEWSFFVAVFILTDPDRTSNGLSNCPPNGLPQGPHDGSPNAVQTFD